MSFWNSVRKFFGLKPKDSVLFKKAEQFSSMADYKRKQENTRIHVPRARLDATKPLPQQKPGSVTYIQYGNRRSDVVNNVVNNDPGVSLMDAVIMADLMSSDSQPDIVYVDQASGVPSQCTSYDWSDDTSSCSSDSSSYDSSDSSSSCDSGGGSDW